MTRTHTPTTQIRSWHSRSTRRARPHTGRCGAGVLTGLLVVTMSACGAGESSTSDAVATGDANTADAALVETSSPTSDDSQPDGQPASQPDGTDVSASTESGDTTVGSAALDTTADADAPVVTDAPVVIELTPELAAFAAAHGDLVTEWSDQLQAFGAEAIEYLDDVSKAPAAPQTQELSDQLISAIDADTIDPGLVTLRDFATGMATAVGHSIDGDQDSALSVFLGLQAGQLQLSAVLDEIKA